MKPPHIAHRLLFIAAAVLGAQAQTFAQGGAPPSDDAFKMGSPPALAEGLTEEDMWPAATAEGWSRPCLVTWQRTFDDALRVARAERKPILVAVNMDGEIASEHFAGVRYREPATAAQMDAYVCVIASVYRHTPRDYDENGNRVACPRFGTVTCSEHIENERTLYDLYFDGNRVSPRHIVLDIDGTEQLDVFYSWDTDTVFSTFRKGLEGRPAPLPRAEPTLQNLARSANVEDREALEREYAQGDRETKARILRTLVEEHTVDQVEVIRSAIFGFDLELAHIAERALAKCETEGALDVMAEALNGPIQKEGRTLLLDAVDRIAETSPRARTLAALHSGLSRRSPHIDEDALEARAREYEANAAASVDVSAREHAAEAHPGDPAALLAFAEALLTRAVDASDAGERQFSELLFEDARAAVGRAREAGAANARVDAVLAITAAAGGDWPNAHTRAIAAVEGGLLRAEGDPMGAAATLDVKLKTRVLLLFADARRRSIRTAYRAGEEWPPEWLSDLNAAHAVLTQGPLDNERLLVDHHDFLRWIGASQRANAVLDDALLRFPDAPALHERLRARLLWDGGPEGLEQGYAARLEQETAADAEPTQLTWFAGYASLVAAEHHRRRSEFDAAVAAYERGIAHFEDNIERFPAGRDSCDHFIALGRAGLARVALEHGDLERATLALLDALHRRPDSAASEDGLGLTPIATAKMLKARLLDAGDEVRAASVQDALDALDPKLLEPPPAEPRDLRRGRRNAPPPGR